MANELTLPATFSGALATAFQNAPQEDLGAGIQASYAVVGYKGKVWTIKYQGAEYPLMRNDPNDPGPRSSIEAVIVKASNGISKIYYSSGYQEGSTAAPDCFSNNGVTPDASVVNKQSMACATCPHNAWGSKVTEQGKQTKACQDSKRIAIVPAPDMNNEFFGGPMLLRVPPASLRDLKTYGDQLQQHNFPYFAVKTRISFDAKEAYPRFVFQPIQPLNNQEAEIVIALRDDPRTQRILEVQEAAAPQQVAPPPPASPFGMQPGMQQAAPQPAYQPPVQQPVPQQPVPQQPVPQQPVYAQPQPPMQPAPQPQPVYAPQPQPQPVYAQPQPQPQNPPQGPAGAWGVAPQPQAQTMAPPQATGGTPPGVGEPVARKPRAAPKRSTPPAQPQNPVTTMQMQPPAPVQQTQPMAPQPQPGMPTGYPYPQPQPQQPMQQQPQAAQQPVYQTAPAPQVAQPPQPMAPQGGPTGAQSFDTALEALFPTPPAQ